MIHPFQLLTFLVLTSSLFAQEAEVFPSAQPVSAIRSPDDNVKIEFGLHEGALHWTVSFAEHVVLQKSRLGLQPKGNPYGQFQIHSFEQSSHDQTWQPVWGKASSIRNHYRQGLCTLEEVGGERRQLTVILRAYNNAVAVRYQIPGTGEIDFDADLGDYRFAEDFTCWSANGERANIGPVALSEYSGSQLPLTVKVANDCYASLLEAALYDYAPLSLKRSGDTSFKANFGLSSVTLPSQSSWRVLLLGATPGDLLANHTMVNLNPPNQIKDSSWIKPGVAMWDWRAWGATTEDGFTYALDMESWKRQIDFAAKYKLAYLLLDAGWYGLEFDPQENPTTSRDHLVIQPDPDKPHLIRKPAPNDWKNPIDVPALIRYGRNKNVGIILYLNDAAQQNHDLEATLSTYQKWGAAGIKYGFMRAMPQEKVLKTRQIVALCAKHKLLCDFHDGPIAPSGDQRTFPNYLAREFCHSQSDAMRTFTPGTFCTTVFTNMLSGPLDMCNGLYSINDAKSARPKIFAELHSTVVAETARVMIVYSGLALLPDIPEAYEAKADLFEFIAKLPMTWDETRILHGEIGHHITTARRSHEEWFVASCCDENGAELLIDLDFLRDDEIYTATLYEDGPNAHFKSNRESYQTKTIEVQKGDCITAKLAPGGGHCLYLRPK
jgi:hypothetical protein